MRLFLFGILGLFVQGMGLAAFVVASRSSVANFGKPAIIAITGIAVCTLLWEGVRRSKGFLAVCSLPLMLAIGYGIAFYLVGFFGFSGLLRGAGGASFDYLLSFLQVVGFLFFLYSVGTTLFFAVNRGFRKMRSHADQQSPKLS